MHTQSLQSCLILWNPMDWGGWQATVHGVAKSRTWLKQFSTHTWTTARQARLSIGFSRQEYWSGLLCPPPGDLLHQGIEPESLMSPALAGGFFTTSALWEAPYGFQAPREIRATLPDLLAGRRRRGRNPGFCSSSATTNCDPRPPLWASAQWPDGHSVIGVEIGLIRAKSVPCTPCGISLLHTPNPVYLFTY